MTWVKWVLVCRCGRKCARAVATPIDEQPPGLVISVRYTCGGCGTEYLTVNNNKPRKVKGAVPHL